MNKDNIPYDKTGAELFLTAQKLALLELHSLIIKHNLNTSSDITGLINNLVEELDEELE